MNETATSPGLAGTADIAIIGAGIAGASAAASLASERSVLLLEQESQPGQHATGRSAAYFAPAYGSDVVRAITRASAEFFFRPPKNFTSVPLVTPRPALFVGTAQQQPQLRELARNVSSCVYLDSAGCLAKVSILKADQIAGGVLDTTGGDIDVDALLQGFLRQARQHGARLQTNVRVTALAQSGNGWLITTSQGQYRANTLVNAAGAWADPIARLAGLGGLGLTPKRRTALLVDAPPDFDTQWPLVIDADEQYYFKPDAGQLLLSPADETPSKPMDAQPQELGIAVAVDRVQQVATLPVRHVRHAWAGLRTFAPDKNFVVGSDPRCTNFYWLAGQGGYGVQSSPALADMVLADLCGTTQHLTLIQAQRFLTELRPARLL